MKKILAFWYPHHPDQNLLPKRGEPPWCIKDGDETCIYLCRKTQVIHLLGSGDTSFTHVRMIIPPEYECHYKSFQRLSAVNLHANCLRPTASMNKGIALFYNIWQVSLVPVEIFLDRRADRSDTLVLDTSFTFLWNENTCEQSILFFNALQQCEGERSFAA